MDDEKLIAHFIYRHHLFDEFYEPPKKKRRYKGEGSIRQKGNSYEGRLTINGVSKSVYGRTKKEVVEKLKNLQLQPSEDKKPTNPPTCPTLVEWLEIWLEEYHKNYSDSTRARYNLFIDKISTFDIGNTPVNLLTPLSLQQFINSLSSYEVAKKNLSMLKNALSLAKENGLTEKNAAASVTISAERNAPKFKDEEKALTLEEEKAFVSAIANNKYRSLYLLSLYAGLRRGEVCSLTWEDIDFTKRTISVNKASSRSLSGGYATGKTKTRTSVRTVPIQQCLYDIMISLKGTGLIYNNNGKPLNSDILTMDFAEIMRSLNQKHTFHQLRHTFATRCYEKGINPKAVQIWLGHASLEMTTGTYTHATTDLLSAEMEKLK